MLVKCYKKFFSYFQDNRKSLKKYSYLSFIVGTLELFGIALTYPFVLKLLSENKSENWISSPLVIGVSIIILFIAKNLLMIFYTYLQAKFAKAVEAEVNITFLQYSLSAPYQDTMRIRLAQ